jgi:hypothetical protein
MRIAQPVVRLPLMALILPDERIAGRLPRPDRAFWFHSNFQAEFGKRWH